MPKKRQSRDSQAFWKLIDAIAATDLGIIALVLIFAGGMFWFNYPAVAWSLIVLGAIFLIARRLFNRT